jgi:hypothetical protein
MLKPILLLFLLFFVATHENFAQIQTITNPCEIYGVVSVQTIRSRADFLVYVEEDEFLATLRVFKEENKLLANKPGMWHFTETHAFADFSIFFVNDRALADVIIYYTDKEFFAGCVK